MRFSLNLFPRVVAQNAFERGHRVGFLAVTKRLDGFPLDGRIGVLPHDSNQAATAPGSSNSPSASTASASTS